MIHLQIDTYEEINSFENIYKFINCMVEIKNYYEFSITDNVEIYELRPQNYNSTFKWEGLVAAKMKWHKFIFKKNKIKN